MKHFEAFETKTHFYLELAMREEIPLLTLDKGLIKAAKKMNVPLKLSSSKKQ